MTTPLPVATRMRFCRRSAIGRGRCSARFDEDLGRAGDITSMATIRSRPLAAPSWWRGGRRDCRVAARGRDVSKAVARSSTSEPNCRTAATVAAGVHVLTISGPAARRAGRRAHPLEDFSAGCPALHPHARLWCPYRRHQHAASAAPAKPPGPACAGKNMRYAAAAGLQSPLPGSMTPS